MLYRRESSSEARTGYTSGNNTSSYGGGVCLALRMKKTRLIEPAQASATHPSKMPPRPRRVVARAGDETPFSSVGWCVLPSCPCLHTPELIAKPHSTFSFSLPFSPLPSKTRPLLCSLSLSSPSKFVDAPTLASSLPLLDRQSGNTGSTIVVDRCLFDHLSPFVFSLPQSCLSFSLFAIKTSLLPICI